MGVNRGRGALGCQWGQRGPWVSMGMRRRGVGSHCGVPLGPSGEGGVVGCQWGAEEKGSLGLIVVPNGEWGGGVDGSQ